VQGQHHQPSVDAFSGSGMPFAAATGEKCVDSPDGQPAVLNLMKIEGE